MHVNATSEQYAPARSCESLSRTGRTGPPIRTDSPLARFTLPRGRRARSTLRPRPVQTKAATAAGCPGPRPPSTPSPKAGACRKSMRLPNATGRLKSGSTGCRQGDVDHGHPASLPRGRRPERARVVAGRAGCIVAGIRWLRFSPDVGPTASP